MKLMIVLRLLYPKRATNVQDLHGDLNNAGALFQVASQFNLLEMVSPEVSPEHGVGIYENDFTRKAPACNFCRRRERSSETISHL